VTGKSSWLTLVDNGKEEQPRTLWAKGNKSSHFLLGALYLHLPESEGVQGSQHYKHSSRAREEHSCLNTARFEDSMNRTLLITSGNEWTNPAVPTPRASWGVTPGLRNLPSQQCSLPGQQRGVLGK